MKICFFFLVYVLAMVFAASGLQKFPEFKRYDDPATKDPEEFRRAIEKQAYRSGVEEFDQVIHHNRLRLKEDEIYRVLDFHFRRVSIDSLANIALVKEIRDSLSTVSRDLKQLQHELNAHPARFAYIERRPYLVDIYRQQDSSFYINVYSYLKFIKNVALPQDREKLEKKLRTFTGKPDPVFQSTSNMLNRYEALANRCLSQYKKLQSTLEPELLVIVHQSRANDFYYLFHHYEISGTPPQKKTQMHKYLKNGTYKGIWLKADYIDFDEQLERIRTGRL